MRHDFIKTGDADAHRHIQDRNGEVCLSECRRCGQAEGELADECPGLTARTITDEQIRELRTNAGRDVKWNSPTEMQRALRDLIDECYVALSSFHHPARRHEARARCAEILNARKEPK